MGKQVNPNLGHGICLITNCSEIVPFRRSKAGKWYFDCAVHGRITPNLPGGQEAIMDCAVIWGPNGPPPECPRWIAENRSVFTAVNPGAREPIGQSGTHAPDVRSPKQPEPATMPAPPPPPTPPEPPKSENEHEQKRERKTDPKNDASGFFNW